MINQTSTTTRQTKNKSKKESASLTMYLSPPKQRNEDNEISSLLTLDLNMGAYIALKAKYNTLPKILQWVEWYLRGIQRLSPCQSVDIIEILQRMDRPIEQANLMNHYWFIDWNQISKLTSILSPYFTNWMITLLTLN